MLVYPTQHTPIIPQANCTSYERDDTELKKMCASSLMQLIENVTAKLLSSLRFPHQKCSLDRMQPNYQHEGFIFRYLQKMLPPMILSIDEGLANLTSGPL